MRTQTKQFFLRQWDTLIAFVAAAVVSGLAAFGVVSGDAVSASALLVLALVSVALVKDREARERLDRAASDLVGLVSGLQLRVQSGAEVQAIPASDIGAEVLSGLATTTFWRYKGGTGTYLRAETLPRLSAGATTQRDIWIEIIDPSSVESCKFYADYRRRLTQSRSTADQASWTQSRVRLESYATVVAAAWYSQHRNVRVQIGLSKHVSTFRYDMSSQSLVITNDTARSSALKAPADSPVYLRFIDELTYSFDQATPLALRDVAELPVDKLSGSEAKAVLLSLGLMPKNDAWFTDAVCSEIAFKAISETHAQLLGFSTGGAQDPYPPELAKQSP